MEDRPAVGPRAPGRSDFDTRWDRGLRQCPLHQSLVICSSLACDRGWDCAKQVRQAESGKSMQGLEARLGILYRDKRPHKLSWLSISHLLKEIPYGMFGSKGYSHYPCRTTVSPVSSIAVRCSSVRCSGPTLPLVRSTISCGSTRCFLPPGVPAAIP